MLPSVLLLLINPNGAHLLLYPLSKFHDPLARQYLGEWSATDISDPFYWPFALLAGGYVALLILRRPRVPASDLLLALALTGLAGVASAPCAATAENGRWRKLDSKGAPSLIDVSMAG